MGREVIGKSFKSGNSVAIRIPAALGVKPGGSWHIHSRDDGSLVFRPADSPETSKLQLGDLFGLIPDLEQIPEDQKEHDIWGPKA